jgi:hypothetical protein
VPEVVEVCLPGQIDLNRAGAADIARGLGVSAEVATKVIYGRPYLSVTDLSFVNGIGPGGLKPIVAAQHACVLPPTSPPPANEACTSQSQVDLQSAPSAELQNRLGLARPAADAVVRGRPYAALLHIAPERVPGLGESAQRVIAATGCLTPAAVRTATATYRWAYRTQTTTVERDGFSLTAPAGVIDGNGAWLSVTDVAQSPLEVKGPTASFHVHGTWANGTDTVIVSSPVDSMGDTMAAYGLVPSMLHIMASGAIEMFPSASTTVSAGKVSVHTTSLSTFVSTLLPPVPTLPYVSPLTEADLFRHLARTVLQKEGETPTCAETKSSLVRTDGSAIAHGGIEGAPALKYCDGLDGETGRWKFVNNTGVVISLYVGNGDPYTHNAPKIVGRNSSGDSILDAVFDKWDNFPSETNSRPIVEVMPGQEIDVRGEPELITAPGHVRQDQVATAVAFSFKYVAAGRVIGGAKKAIEIFDECIGSGVSNAVEYFRCGKAAAEAGGESALRKFIEVMLFAADGAVTVNDSLHVPDTDVLMTVLHAPPPPSPGQPTTGLISGGGSSSSAGKMLVKLTTGPESYRITQDGHAEPIPDGGTYICNARVLPVRYQVDPAQLSQIAPKGFGPPATCPNAPAASLSPDPPASIHDVILRKGDGESWIVGPEGRRVALVSGSDFNCFAKSYFVWDYVSDSEVARFPVDSVIAGRFCLS